jgi:hypothetical protein
MKNKRSSFMPLMLAIVVLALGYTACEGPVGPQGEKGDPDELNELYEYLIAQSGGRTSSDPVYVKVTIQLTEPNYLELLGVLERARKYVSLDLTECDFSDSSSSTGGLNKNLQFNCIPAISTGKARIVHLDLPVETKEISGSFANFNSLKTINGDNVTTITNSAFNNLSTLVTANFPKVTNIGSNAFQNCINLAEMSLSATATITSNPFVGCLSVIFNVTGNGSLSTTEDGRALVRNQTDLISYPSATGSLSLDYITTLGTYSLARTTITEGVFENVITVGSDAFDYCGSLVSLNLPKAATFNSWAFSNNTNLKKLDIPSVRQIDYYAFSSSGNVPLEITMGTTAPGVLGNSIFSSITKTVTVRVPAGAIGYDDEWTEAFKGKGTSGTGTVNTSLTLIIEEAP